MARLQLQPDSPWSAGNGRFCAHAQSHLHFRTAPRVQPFSPDRANGERVSNATWPRNWDSAAPATSPSAITRPIGPSPISAISGTLPAQHRGREFRVRAAGKTKYSNSRPACSCSAATTRLNMAFRAIAIVIRSSKQSIRPAKPLSMGNGRQAPDQPALRWPTSH